MGHVLFYFLYHVTFCITDPALLGLILNVCILWLFLVQWERYMRCDGTPDPTIAAEVNTYINLWHEDISSNNIDAVIQESKQTLAVSTF